MDDDELMEMAADGAIPPSFESAPSWRSAFGDPSPTPIMDERVLLSSHISRGFSLPPSAFMIEILDHYGPELHNITPSSLLYISGFVALFEGYLGLAPRLDFFLIASESRGRQSRRSCWLPAPSASTRAEI